MADKKKFDIDFETAIKRIDEISAKLEDNSLKLDESIELYEEGVSLVAFCRAKLDQAQQKISCLSVNEDGEIAESAFSVEAE